jgi:hypothetical protein
MDPWIESQRWEQFHFEFIGEAARQLVPLVRPRYEIAPEQRISMPEEHREAFLVIRDRRDMCVVTVIELWSPTNKTPRSDGRELYLRKRQSVLESRTNLVEVDLLRGGRRLPTVERLRPADYYVFVCRGARRPHADVYAWRLRQPLPAVPIPLAPDDREVTLDLQAVFNRVYDDFGYDYALDYRQPVRPSLRTADARWAKTLLAS